MARLKNCDVKHVGTYRCYWKPEKLSKADIFCYTWYFPVQLLLWVAGLLRLLVSTLLALVSWLFCLFNISVWYIRNNWHEYWVFSISRPRCMRMGWWRGHTGSSRSLWRCTVVWSAGQSHSGPMVLTVLKEAILHSSRTSVWDTTRQTQTGWRWNSKSSNPPRHNGSSTHLSSDRNSRLQTGESVNIGQHVAENVRGWKCTC
jgi:hypothetical protein